LLARLLRKNNPRSPSNIPNPIASTGKPGIPIGKATPEVTEEIEVEVTDWVDVPGQTCTDVRNTGEVRVLVIVFVSDVKVE